MNNKTYEHKYKLGERVWIKHENGCLSQVMIQTIILEEGWDDERPIKYIGLGGDTFYEDEVMSECMCGRLSR